MTQTRTFLTADDRTIAYTDFGGTGRPLLALHGHVSEGSMWAGLASALAPEWRIIAPDQRGHGDSDRASSYTSAEYASDVLALLDHLGLDSVAVIGHSGGGLTAYHLAALYPSRVNAVIAVEIPAVLPDPSDGSPGPLGFVLGFAYEAPTREELVAGMGPAASFFADRVREQADGTWRLPFHPADTIASEQAGRGDHWDVWTASTCPALVLRGARGGIVSADMAAEMASRRANTSAAALDGDHFVVAQDEAGLVREVRAFLG
jgi:pimeloyl-ACP methyl ester carboxylesterase